MKNSILFIAIGLALASPSFAHEQARDVEIRASMKADLMDQFNEFSVTTYTLSASCADCVVSYPGLKELFADTFNRNTFAEKTSAIVSVNSTANGYAPFRHGLVHRFG